jgi:peptidoglycan/LPS O-acetylase OafA/YrhL
MIATPPNRSYYPALDGLRGVASLLVVIYHNFDFIKNYFFFGWLGLDIFFVLSGFLITDILLNTVGKKNYLRNFYVRRVLRVFPLYYLGLVFFLIILPRIPNIPIRIDYFVDNQVWLWTYLENWLYIFKPSNQDALNHLWSLAVEEQFYLIWPLIILLLRKPKYILIFISLVLLFTVGLRYWVWVNQFEKLAYYNLYTFTRIDGICIGVMVACLQKINLKFLGKNTALIVFIFAGLNFLFYFFNKKYNFSFPYLAIVGYTTFAMIFGLLIYDIVNGGTKFITTIFNIAPLKLIGRISYGCYIIHWPLYLLIGPSLARWSTKNLPFISSHFFASATATILAYIIGYLSYRYFEMRFLVLKKHFV